MTLQACSWTDALVGLADGATLLTGNLRLARRARSEDALRRHRDGEAVWRSGDVLPWSAWLHRLYADALVAGAIGDGEPAVLLSAAQTQALWRRIIEDDLGGDALLRPDPAARLAREAHATCLAWCIDDASLAEAAQHDDVAAFLRWTAQLRRLAQTRGWLLPEDLPAHAARWLMRVPALRPRALYLAGFDEFTPQQQELLTRLLSCDTPVFRTAWDMAPAHLVRIACTDPRDELAAAAHWARQRLEAEPAARVAIVVHDLDAERREALGRHLDTTLDPLARRTIDRRRRLWNVSLGRVLADEPLIRDALLLLEFAAGDLAFPEASALLRSPFLEDADAERTVRVATELALRTARHARVALDTLVDGSLTVPAAPRLAVHLGRMRSAAADRAPRTAAAWVEHFSALLELAGWPGRGRMDSDEYQALAAWQEVLDEVATLGAVLPQLSRPDAFAHLTERVREREFQPASEAVPVQVLGGLEAVGQRFDAVWIVGWHDEAWPQQPQPNPFLPLAVQRRFDVPRATAARELAYAQRMTQHLFATAPDVVVSWPQRVEDRSLRPSPLIAHLPLAAQSPRPLDDRRRTFLAGGAMRWTPRHGPPHAAFAPMRGGTTVLRDQSACAFRAFAIHRLGAVALESPVPGVDPRDRGQLVHRVMDAFWARVQTQDALLAMDAAARRALLTQLIAAEMSAYVRTAAYAATPQTLGLEAQRLVALLASWLDRETDRAPFVVAARERTVELVVEGLRLRGRMDRIDQLADGSLLLIDYKTGVATPADWLGERPRDPQLPLYAVYASDQQLAGVAFAQLRTGECSWRGVVQDPSVLPGAKTPGERPFVGLDWAALIVHWRTATAGLARAFLAGHAAAEPLVGACDHCHLAALCRVDEQHQGQRWVAEGEGLAND